MTTGLNASKSQCQGKKWEWAEHCSQWKDTKETQPFKNKIQILNGSWILKYIYKELAVKSF